MNFPRKPTVKDRGKDTVINKINNHKNEIMETNEIQIDDGTLQIALNDMVGEQREANQVNRDLIAAVNNLANKVDSFNEKLDNIKVTPPGADTSPMELLVAAGLDKMRRIIEAQPKNLIHEKRILFFPDSSSPEYYRVVLSIVFLFIFMVIVVTYGFFLLNGYQHR
jgi:hypothetical protein